MKPSLEADFRAFHAANPEVYRLFCRFAFEVIRAGHKRYSSDAILHRIRWHTSVETRGASEFKINDHYSAGYSRLFLADHPGHAGFFETRERRKEAA